VSDGNEANWERKVLEKLALEALAEQKRGRRWGIFFKLLGFGYLALLLVVALDLGKKIPLRDRYADMPSHRADDLFLIRRVRFARRFFAEKQAADDLVTYDERNKQFDPTPLKTRRIDLKERQHTCGVRIDRVEAVR